ncbi:MAG TPA: GTP cyclohydrolase I FolE [Limnochordia bacterium]|nr:GTP cyclohydrolase I FolE [Limnochordia bacterium]
MVNQEKVKEAVGLLLEAIGEDPARDGLRDTPRRIAEMFTEVFSGCDDDPARHLAVTFKTDHDELVLVRDIPFFSLCEHHFLPFFGQAHVAYLPKNGRVCGLSKLARTVDVFARRPQMQERITHQVADAIMEHLDPLGAAVVLEAEHMCMSMRGVNKPGSRTVTSAMRGIFRTDPKTRAEVLSLINIQP